MKSRDAKSMEMCSGEWQMKAYGSPVRTSKNSPTAHALIRN